MNDEVSRALAKALTKALPIAQNLSHRSTEHYLVWHKRKEGGWLGSWEQRPSVAIGLSEGESSFDEIGAEFIHILSQDYPAYQGMIGFASFGFMRLLHDRSHLLKTLLESLWHRHNTFVLNEEAIWTAVADFATFVDQPALRVRFLAVLINFQMEVDELSLPGGGRIRRLTEDEVSEIYGGPIMRTSVGQRPGSPPCEFAIEDHYEEPKLFGDQEPTTYPAYDELRPRLDKTIRALRTFKEGRVGYESIRLYPTTFCPLGSATILYGDLHIPCGGFYTVSRNEADALCERVEHILKCSEEAMEMACSRLSDAQIRHRAEDRLVDAVIGLEALLLASTGNESYRGELGFRFSLNYASLWNEPEARHAAFGMAKDLYTIRSIVSHGANARKGKLTLGSEKVKIDDAAGRACDVLRWVIGKLLPMAPKALYKSPEFWKNRYFGEVK